MELTGIHHLTAVTADVSGNHRFYVRDLGMRMVKRSVNQDDLGAYHLYYGDYVGSPGTALTFFDWDMPREQRGGNSVTRTGLRVSGSAAIEFWAGRLRELGVTGAEPRERDGRAVIDFEDPEGQRLSLVDDKGAGDDSAPWEDSPVAAEYQIRGLGPIVMTVPDAAPTDTILTQLLRMNPEREYMHPDDDAEVRVYRMGSAGAHAELHVVVRPGAEPARLGAGGVHHVAFRVPTFDDYERWAQLLRELRIPNSGPVDRFWFRSLYFREPGGVLFELATDEPGFAVEESVEELGRRVALPPFLEPRREEIEAGLKPIDGA